MENQQSPEKSTNGIVPANSGPEMVERRYAQIVGWGFHVPDKVITNKDLEQIVDTNDEWIRSRTGIEKRHVAANRSANPLRRRCAGRV